ncbi:hypothetical protein [Streptomyces sp. WAC01526]|uniref:hypothetical protein n=1 Tax=Streptomyces sp. WAC01526 TaxID=2588709 RepID=UPI0011DF2876|nr:hypothetical protein [Streptomyces sp. WAC01526]
MHDFDQPARYVYEFWVLVANEHEEPDGSFDFSRSREGEQGPSWPSFSETFAAILDVFAWGMRTPPMLPAWMAVP